MLNQSEQTESDTAINKSIQQCEIWTMGDPDVELAKTHLMDALDEMHYQFEQLEL